MHDFIWYLNWCVTEHNGARAFPPRKVPPWGFSPSEGSPLGLFPLGRFLPGAFPPRKVPPWGYSPSEGSTLGLFPFGSFPLGLFPLGRFLPRAFPPGRFPPRAFPSRKVPGWKLPVTNITTTHFSQKKNQQIELPLLWVSICSSGDYGSLNAQNISIISHIIIFPLYTNIIELFGCSNQLHRPYIFN